MSQLSTASSATQCGPKNSPAKATESKSAEDPNYYFYQSNARALRTFRSVVKRSVPFELPELSTTLQLEFDFCRMEIWR